MPVSNLDAELEAKLDEVTGAAGKDNTAEIEIPPQAEPPADKKDVAPAAPSKAAAPAAEPQEDYQATIAALKAQVADEQAKRAKETERATRIEREHKETSTKLVSTEQEALNAHERSVENAINAAKSDLANIRASLKEAAAANNFDAHTDLTEKMADAKFQLNSLEAQKKNIANYKSKVEAKAVADSKKAVADSAAEPAYTSKTVAWIANHPRFNSDNKYKAACYGADQEARTLGIELDSDEYFKHIESVLKERGLEKDEDAPMIEVKPAGEKKPAEPSRQSAASTAAPVTRGNNQQGSGYARKNGKLHVSPEVVEYAIIGGFAKDEKDFNGIREYVETAEKLKSEGRIAS